MNAIAVLTSENMLAIAMTILGVVGIPLGAVLVKMWARGERHEERLNSHEKKIDNTDSMVSEIKLTLSTGLAEIKEQIRTLFRDQEKHG